MDSATEIEHIPLSRIRNGVSGAPAIQAELEENNFQITNLNARKATSIQKSGGLFSGRDVEDLT